MANLRRAAQSLLENWRDRAFWFEVAEQRVLKWICSTDNIVGVDIMSADWDSLFILDGCRYDTFIQNQPDSWSQALPVRSKAANTWNFYKRNFDQKYPDTVVVTANGRTTKLRGDSFNKIIPVYETDWNHEFGTVMPDVMAKHTIEAHEDYPNKRIIAHWNQPHYPFVGSDLERYAPSSDNNVWKDLKRGKIDVATVKRAYEDSLRFTLPFVDQALTHDAVSGRIVVSADHGNVFGERPLCWPFPVYGHPRGVLVDELVTVPWMVHEKGDRREIVDGRVRNTAADDLVEDRLKDLGYVD